MKHKELFRSVDTNWEMDSDYAYSTDRDIYFYNKKTGREVWNPNKRAFFTRRFNKGVICSNSDIFIGFDDSHALWNREYVEMGDDKPEIIVYKNGRILKRDLQEHYKFGEMIGFDKEGELVYRLVRNCYNDPILYKAKQFEPVASGLEVVKLGRNESTFYSDKTKQLAPVVFRDYTAIQNGTYVINIDKKNKMFYDSKSGQLCDYTFKDFKMPVMGRCSDFISVDEKGKGTFDIIYNTHNNKMMNGNLVSCHEINNNYYLMRVKEDDNVITKIVDADGDIKRVYKTKLEFSHSIYYDNDGFKNKERYSGYEWDYFYCVKNTSGEKFIIDTDNNFELVKEKQRKIAEEGWTIIENVDRGAIYIEHKVKEEPITQQENIEEPVKKEEIKKPVKPVKAKPAKAKTSLNEEEKQYMDIMKDNILKRRQSIVETIEANHKRKLAGEDLTNDSQDYQRVYVPFDKSTRER